MTKQKMTIYALTLMTVSHSSFLFAQSGSLLQSAMSWPMQQGESLNDTARLFYPKNQYMQRQFVAATLRLNQETLPDLDAETAFEQESLIAIPDIKALSIMSYGKAAQGAATYADSKVVISAKQQVIYDDLLARNASFTQELGKLNARIVHLQQVYGAIKPDLLGLIDRAPAAVPQVAKAVEVQMAVKPLNVPDAKPSVTEYLSNNPQLANAMQTVARAGQGKPSYFYLWLPALSVLFVIGLFVGLMLHTRRQAERLKETAVSNFASLEKKSYLEYLLSLRPWATNKVGGAINQSEFSDSISEFKPTDEIEEGRLILEQAKNYVNSGRYGHAIRLLNAHIRAVPKAALHHWLYLLDIYHDIGLKDAFLVSAKQLHQTFNVVMPQWKKVGLSDNTTTLDAASHSLEAYGHIVSKVTELWADCEKEASNYAQTKSYLDQLLTDTRNNQRTGFSMDVFEEIVLLRDTLDAREKLTQAV